VNDLARLAHANGRQDLEERVRAEAARWGARGTTVVVVGEAGRGKSSFVNALLGYPDLLPVDEDSSTSVHIVIRYSPTLTVRVHQEGGDASQEIVLERVREWATEHGNPSNAQRVQAVEIGLDHPLLARGVVLVDTPGVASLSVAGTDATLAALAWADALILVTSAAAPLAAPEVEFLERAAERVETILVVLTKTDAHPGWRTIVEDDRATLGRRLPAYAEAPVFPVSSRLKAAADRSLAQGDAEFARELVEESGFPALADGMAARIVGRTQALRMGNLLRSAETIMAGLELPHQAVVAAADGSPEARAAFEANQARLQDYAKAASAGLARLGDAFEIVRIQVVGELGAALGELGRRLEAHVAEAEPRDLDGIEDRLRLELTTIVERLSGSLESQLVEAISTIARTLAAEVGVQVDALPAPTVSADTALSTGTGDRGLYAFFRAHYYPFLMGSGITGTLGGLATAVGVASVSTVGAPIAIASLAAGTITALIGRRATSRAQTRQRAREVVRGVLADARTDIQVALQRRLVESRRAVEIELRDQLDMRTRELREAVELGQQTLSADRATRQRVRAEASQRLQELLALRLRVAEIRGVARQRAAATSTVGGRR
jgi:GTPase Era involved in 16S rRNA processing